MSSIILSSMVCIVLPHFSHYLIRCAIFGKRILNLIFSTTFVWNISHFKKNSARYHKCTQVFMYSNRYTCQIFNTLNAELNPICHLLALLGAHHILHVSRIRVNKAWISVTDFWSVLVSNFIHISSLRAELFHANRQTGMTNLIGGFHNFEKAPKN